LGVETAQANLDISNESTEQGGFRKRGDHGKEARERQGRRQGTRNKSGTRRVQRSGKGSSRKGTGTRGLKNGGPQGNDPSSRKQKG